VGIRLNRECKASKRGIFSTGIVQKHSLDGMIEASIDGFDSNKRSIKEFVDRLKIMLFDLLSLVPLRTSKIYRLYMAWHEH
jgi:hypothetical protein